MSGATRWWWIRHAPVLGVADRINGRTDVPCDLSDKKTLAALAKALPAEPRVLVSPLRRARRSLEALRDLLPDCPQGTVEPAFVEQDFGEWEGKSWAEIGAAAEEFWKAPADIAPPGGESFAQLCTRVQVAIRRIAETASGGDILILAHAGPIRAALALALDLPPARALAFEIAPLSLTRLGNSLENWWVETANSRLA